MKRLAKVLVCLTVGLMTARAAAAAPVTVNYSFEVDKVEDYKNYMLGGNVKKGDVLHGTIVFDSDAADESPEADWGFYSFLSPYAFTLSLPTSIVCNEFYVQVHDAVGDFLHDFQLIRFVEGAMEHLPEQPRTICQDDTFSRYHNQPTLFCKNF